MKLNLLPTYVSKGGQARSAIVVAALLVVAAAVIAFVMVTKSNRDLQTAKEQAAALVEPAQKAVDTSNLADTVILKGQEVIRNINLAEAMKKHNAVYPDLYDEVKRYIPSYFRVTTMTATPTDPATATVNLTGSIKTYQQYADLMLVLSRIPNFISISRAGYQNNDLIVPPLALGSQSGRPVKPGEAMVPDDPLQRLALEEASGGVTGFTATGNFGTTPDATRFAMPNYSLITVNVVLARNLQTPVPKQTLAAGSAGAAAPGSVPAGFQGGAKSAPTPPPPAASSSGGRKIKDRTPNVGD